MKDSQYYSIAGMLNLLLANQNNYAGHPIVGFFFLTAAVLAAGLSALARRDEKDLPTLTVVVEGDK